MGSTFFSGFSCPNLIAVFLNLLIVLGTCCIFFCKCWDFLWVFICFSVPYFGLACDHGNSFLCLEEYEREGTTGQKGF